MYIHIYGKLQNFIQLSLNLTLVCHIKCNHPVNFHFSLYRFHRKGWMATKFTRPQPTWLSSVGCKCNASGISRSSVKARDHSGARLKSALQQIWDDLPQTAINKAILTTSECMHLGRWWTFWTYDMNFIQKYFDWTLFAVSEEMRWIVCFNPLFIVRQ